MPADSPNFISPEAYEYWLRGQVVAMVPGVQTKELGDVELADAHLVEAVDLEGHLLNREVLNPSGIFNGLITVKPAGLGKSGGIMYDFESFEKVVPQAESSS